TAVALKFGASRWTATAIFIPPCVGAHRSERVSVCVGLVCGRSGRRWQGGRVRSLAPRGSRAQALPVTDERTRARERLTTAFGWLSGGALGLLANFGVYRAVGDTYPVTISTFIVFVAGAFGGSWLAD